MDGAEFIQMQENEMYWEHLKNLKKTGINKELLQHLLNYDELTGKLHWKKRDSVWFDFNKNKSIHAMNAWNAKFAGKEAFTSKDKNGYFRGAIFHKVYYAHRIIWLLYYGEEVKNIDHINGNTSDNRIANIRNVSHQENHKNRKLNINNSSGVLGLSWASSRNKWEAKLTVNGKTKHLGRFKDKNIAIQAINEAKKHFCFHENHGKSTTARTGTMGVRK